MTTDYRALCAELLNGLDELVHPRYPFPGYTRCAMDRARALLAEPVAEGPTDDEIEEWADACPEAPLEEMDPEVHGWRRCFTAKEFSETIRAALARWGRPAAAPVPEPGEVPRIGHILRLAEIIREVDGRHDKGAAALAEAILSHPGICSAGLAALDEADGPAVPDGREPASVALQPSDEELETFLVDVACQNGDMYYADPRVLARAVLDRWGRPAAAPVAMIELITDMSMHLAHMQELLEDYEYGDPEDYHWYRESVRLRAVAAEVLA